MFGSEYRTAPGHVDPQQVPGRLIDGGPIAVALAPSGFHELAGYTLDTIGAVGEDGDPSCRNGGGKAAANSTAPSADRATANVGLMVVGSKPGTVTGRVRVSASALPDRARALSRARPAARRGGGVLAVPAEAERFTRGLAGATGGLGARRRGRRRRRARGSARSAREAQHRRSDCVTLDQAGVMGGGTWRFCGADAVTFCLNHAADDSTLADRCRRLDDNTSPSSIPPTPRRSTAIVPSGLRCTRNGRDVPAARRDRRAPSLAPRACRLRAALSRSSWRASAALIAGMTSLGPNGFERYEKTPAPSRAPLSAGRSTRSA